MIVARSSASVRLALMSTFASLAASISARMSCARLIGAPDCERIAPTIRSRYAIWRSKSTTVTLVQDSTWVGGRPGRRRGVSEADSRCGSRWVIRLPGCRRRFGPFPKPNAELDRGGIQHFPNDDFKLMQKNQALDTHSGRQADSQ